MSPQFLLIAAVAAVGVLRGQGLSISDAALRQGLESVEWPGRLELVSGKPELLLDGAHNPAGARVLRDYLREYARGRRLVLLFGAMRDKAVGEIADLLFSAAEAVVVTQPHQKRAASPEIISKAAGHLNPALVLCPDPREALEAAKKLAGDGGLVVVTGSLYLVGEIKQALMAAKTAAIVSGDQESRVP